MSDVDSLPQSDQIEGAPHPRETPVLFGRHRVPFRKIHTKIVKQTLYTFYKDFEVIFF